MRFGIAAFAAALTLAPAPGVAQDTAAPATNTPAAPADTIGPRELEDFSLNGTVTRPAPAPPARTAPAPGSSRPVPATATPRASPAPDSGPAPARERAAPSSVPGPSASPPLPPADSLLDSPTPAPADPSSGLGAEPGFEPAAPSPGNAPGDEQGNVLPWLIALALLAGAAGLYFRRQRSQPSYATAGAAGRHAVPEPEPAPQPYLRRTPSPRPAQPPASSGIVTTRLRPWLDIEFSPGRCVVEDDKATIQFDVIVHNTGSAPARDVLIEASMFNAGPRQDQEIGAFFAHPVAKGDRIPAIPPLKRVALKSAVSLNRDQMRQFEVAGRRLFVPLIGFNALYRWGGGEGQTSASYLVGRDTNSEKMAPLRLDLGPRIFRGLGAREHNVRVRK